MIKYKHFLFGFLTSLFFLAVSFLVVPQVVAGTDLDTTCPAFGTCTVSPNGVPLLDENGWIPGSSVTQRFSVENTSGDNGFVGIEAENYSETKNLGEVIDVEIREGSAVGSVIYGGVTLQDFKDDGFFTIDAISAGQNIDYYFIATMQPTAGNEYQGAQANFDLKLGLEIAPIPPTSGGGSGSGGSSSGGGSGGSASAPVCTDNPPSAAPSVTITNVGTNTVSLVWTAVDPVSHYGIAFTRTSDGAQYGSTNIGNTTSFTITNLSGGANYTFEVFGVNGCAPGPAGSAGSGTVPGPVIDSRPIGGGQVLGESDDDQESEESEQDAEGDGQDSENDGGIVAGLTDEQCQPWRFYVPWILLVAQLGLVMANEFFFRRNQSLTKHFITVGITLVSIFLFYLLKECPCYEASSAAILVWLCTWYWIVASVLSVLLRGVSYAFIEEVEKPVATPVVDSTNDKKDSLK